MANFFFLAEPFFIAVSSILLISLPGWALTYRFNPEPLERSVVCILTGLTLIYLCEFGAYLLSLPSWFPFILLLLVSLISVFNFARSRSNNSLRETFPWVEVMVWLVLSIWGLAIQFKIVLYGAQLGWAADWVEHYERSIFFLEQLPPETNFLNGLWSLSARGPLFNSSAGLLMGGLGKDYWTYQIIATVLNTFPVLTLALLLQNISGLQRYPALIWSAVIYALAPFAVQQIIYPWTKMFTTGFILMGIHVYLRGAKRGDICIMAWAFFPLALGVLAHYMTVLFAVFFLAHLLYTIIKNNWRFQALIIPISSCILLLSTWFIFLILNFGIVGTFIGNSTLGGEYTEAYNRKLGVTIRYQDVLWANTLSTLVPYSLRHGWKGLGRSPDSIKQGWQLQPKDFSPEEIEINRQIIWKLDLINNQSTLPGNIGWTGLAAFLIVVFWYFKRKIVSGNSIPFQNDLQNVSPGNYFWVIFFILGIFLNLLSLKVYSPQGMSYMSFQPFLFLLIVFLFKWLRNAPKKIIICLSGLFLLESIFKTYIWIQMHTRVVTLEEVPGSGLVIRGPGLNEQYVANYLRKLKDGTFYLSDQFGEISSLMSLTCVGLIVVITIGFLRNWLRVEKY
jgi:hypothetical protein